MWECDKLVRAFVEELLQKVLLFMILIQTFYSVLFIHVVMLYQVLLIMITIMNNDLSSVLIMEQVPKDD